MSDLRIVAVQNRRQQREFLHLPWKLYRGDPNWIPPLRQNQKELVGFARHPYYEHAVGQAFLAYRGSECCGRLHVHINSVHNERYAEARGFFGFFESTDDQGVASGLFDAGRAWLADRGIQQVRGPVNPSLNYECGLLIEGFDEPPTFMMTYNPPYYGRLLESYGFRKVEDLHAFWGHVDMLESLDAKLAWVTEDATRRFNVQLRPMNRRNFNREVRLFLEIYNQSLGGTWGFTPLSEGEIDHMSASLKWLIVPELTTIAEVDGEPVAAVFALLDYNPRIRLIDGRLFPFGFLRLLRNRREIPRIRVISTNVVPKYQKWGLGLVVLSRLVPVALEWGIQEAEFSWVLESNTLSFKTLQRGGAKLTKSYRLYDYGPTEDSPERPEPAIGKAAQA